MSIEVRIIKFEGRQALMSYLTYSIKFRNNSELNSQISIRIEIRKIKIVIDAMQRK
jgi:hypothetical protein